MKKKIKITKNVTSPYGLFFRSAVHEDRRERRAPGHVRAGGRAQVSDDRGRGRDGRSAGEHVRLHVPDAQDHLFHGPRRSAVQVSAGGRNGQRAPSRSSSSRYPPGETSRDDGVRSLGMSISLTVTV